MQTLGRAGRQWQVLLGRPDHDAAGGVARFRREDEARGGIRGPVAQRRGTLLGGFRRRIRHQLPTP